MDSKAVLLALEEGEKWRRRHARLAQKLAETQARRKELETKLTRVRNEIDSLEDAVASLRRQEPGSEGGPGEIIR